MHLRYVIEVEKTGSITRAAKNLFMGQPNLSKAVKELENEIGITLFKRTVRGAEPTEEGAEFLNYARAILSQVDELEALYKPRKDRGMRMTLSASRGPGWPAVLSGFLRHLQKEQGLDLSLKESCADEILEDVISRKSDLGILCFLTSQRDGILKKLEEHHLQHELLFEQELCILAGANSVYARQGEQVDLSKLKEGTQLVYGDCLCQEQDSAGKRIAVYDRGTLQELLMQLEDSYSWSFPIPVGAGSQSGLVQLQAAQGNLPAQAAVIYPKQQLLSPCAAQFLSFLRSYGGGRILL